MDYAMQRAVGNSCVCKCLNAKSNLENKLMQITKSISRGISYYLVLFKFDLFLSSLKTFFFTDFQIGKNKMSKGRTCEGHEIKLHGENKHVIM